MSRAPVQPFTVGEVVLTSLDALTSAAALHLGEAMPGGGRLERPDPQEAWKAILAASGMLHHVGALMQPEALARAESRLQAVARRLASLHPDAEFPVPEGIARTLGR